MKNFMTWIEYEQNDEHIEHWMCSQKDCGWVRAVWHWVGIACDLYKVLVVSVCVCVCVYSNSRNDVPRVAQRYGTIAAHTRCRASVLVVFVVFWVHMHSFAGLIRRTPLPAFSGTAVTDRHSDTTIFQLRAHWVRISWSIMGKIVRTCAPGGSQTLDFLHARRAPYPLGQALC